MQAIKKANWLSLAFDSGVPCCLTLELGVPFWGVSSAIVVVRAVQKLIWAVWSRFVGECVTELEVGLTSCEYIPVRLGLSTYQGQVRRLADQNMGLKSIGKQGPSSGPQLRASLPLRAGV